MEKLAASAGGRRVKATAPHLSRLDITILLRDRGYKVTPQRMAIYDVLSTTDTHPNAEMLFHRLQPEYPAMSLATVYKTIEMLKTVGVVAPINIGEDCFRYEIVSGDHPHLICTECSRVEDVDELDCGNFTKSLRQLKNFTLHKQRIYFYGICAACMEAAAKQEQRYK